MKIKTRKKHFRGGSHGDPARKRARTASPTDAIPARKRTASPTDARPAMMVMGKFQPFTIGHLMGVVRPMIVESLKGGGKYDIYVCTSNKENYTEDLKRKKIEELRTLLSNTKLSSKEKQEIENKLEKAKKKPTVEEELEKLANTSPSSITLEKIAKKQATDTTPQEVIDLIKNGIYVNYPGVNDTPLGAAIKVSMIKAGLNDLKKDTELIRLARKKETNLSDFIDKRVDVESFDSLFPALYYVEERHSKQENILYCGTDRGDSYREIIKKKKKMVGIGKLK